jgi:citrate lyase subunit alpha/citrate CoA-transferase
MLSALEIDIDFNVNVMTGSNGVLRGASGGHSDTAAGADLTIHYRAVSSRRIPASWKRC